ncbi:PAS domain-containing protein [Paucibacter sp. XJ19-41]|uniref:PAS domain-containing protein n=1 Tax=Paucibacter sp. XJ19-41 TaxID=2927824 RepID=UPI00234AFC15|nr:PAS domain-containing protein [Paucibacter sp. XJ19-41]MDC6168931.1 PAS domain-containing protein [Paucibacter sp. XJ19-41]
MSTASEDPSDLSALSPLASELANTIARVASDIALVIDKDGVISAVAEGQAVQAQGCGDWVGQRWVDTVTASTRGKIQSLLDEVTTEGVVSRRREVSHPAQGGQELPLTWAAIRLGADGPVLAVGRDLRAVAAIQQRFVEAQQELEHHFWSRRQAESRYQLLFQVANDAVLVLDALSLKVLEANAASAALLGHDAGSIQGRPLSESLPPSARAAVLELLATARSSGRAGEIRVRGPAGALDVSATPFRADEAQLILVRARREDAASADSLALARMAEFVETTPDAVVITDSAGAVLMANPAFLRLAHQANELALRGRALSELLLDADGGWAQVIERVRSTGIVASASLEVGSPSGDPQTVQVTAALMTEGEQACLGFILRPGRPAVSLQATGDDVLAGLLDQVGQVPLADLLVEVAHRAERQLIASALLRSGGRRDAAAEALGMTSEALGLRMQRHGLSGLGYLPGNGGSTHLIN